MINYSSDEEDEEEAGAGCSTTRRVLLRFGIQRGGKQDSIQDCNDNNNKKSR